MTMKGVSFESVQNIETVMIMQLNTQKYFIKQHEQLGEVFSKLGKVL